MEFTLTRAAPRVQLDIFQLDQGGHDSGYHLITISDSDVLPGITDFGVEFLNTKVEQRLIHVYLQWTSKCFC